MELTNCSSCVMIITGLDCLGINAPHIRSYMLNHFSMKEVWHTWTPDMC